MPATRSRQGCEECRRRRRKCNEAKPRCGQCSEFDRSCTYPLRLVWSNNRKRRALDDNLPSSNEGRPSASDEVDHLGPDNHELLKVIPRRLPNGIQLSPKYQRLMSYFIDDILASLSCHPSIHQDLRMGLVPVMMASPQLMSACLALSAAGFLSRGISEVDGVNIMSILSHLQTSGLALLRQALGTGQMIETLLATCLIWCLADVFTHRQGMSSWRIHLQGIKALLDGNETHQVSTSPGSIQSAMRHLYQLYLSLQTLPYIPLESAATSTTLSVQLSQNFQWASVVSPGIDGFLGYSNELLDILQQIDRLSHGSANLATHSPFEVDILLGKLKGMIIRDMSDTPEVSICSPLSPEYSREFALCHQIFQQATLIHLYRQLYRLPSGSQPIQRAVAAMEEMLSSMIQGQPCHTWVAMAMPLFTLGCEAYTEKQQVFARDKIEKLEQCIGSLHVKLIRQAVEEVWKLRRHLGDFEGEICASELLGECLCEISQISANVSAT